MSEVYDRSRLLERFLQYVRVHTTADEASEEYPSSAGQWTLGKLLVEHLKAMGLPDVEQDEHGRVWATVPASPGCESAPVIAFNSHLDTSPETSGEDVKPQVIERYEGGDLVLPADPSRVIRVTENPELRKLEGCTLITTDGTTLLGGDDKAGIAVIVETAQVLQEHPEFKHGPVRILFTCDEEIGRGVDHVNVDKLGAAACYTLDGGGANDVDVETFSADLAVVRIEGINIHPSIAKNRMVNAIRAAGDFLNRLPPGLSPERTEGREGFVHPYDIQGGVAEVSIRIILRDFDTEALEHQARILQQAAQETEQAIENCKVTVTTKPQYRNLGDGLAKEPRAVRFVEEAHRRLGRKANLTFVRGGTDGSLLTEKGLPTPNLSTGQHNPHSPLEWACLDEMGQAVEVLTQLCQIWAE